LTIDGAAEAAVEKEMKASAKTKMVANLGKEMILD